MNVDFSTWFQLLLGKFRIILISLGGIPFIARLFKTYALLLKYLRVSLVQEGPHKACRLQSGEYVQASLGF